MALITCPECDKQVSDRAVTCPHCGFPISAIVDSQVSPALSKSSPSAVRSTKKKNNPYFIIGPVLICVLILIVGGIMIKNSVDQKAAEDARIASEQAAEQAAEESRAAAEAAAAAEAKARAEYIAGLNSFLLHSLSGAAEAERVCVLTHDVWYNAIYEKYDDETDPYTNISGIFWDFETAIQRLYKSSEITTAIAHIEENQNTVDELYLALQNPTDEFISYYQLVDELYDAYRKLTGLALSHTGSLKTYTEYYQEYDSGYLSAYQKLELLIPGDADQDESTAPETESAAPEFSTTYVLDKSKMKFHYAHCRILDSISMDDQETLQAERQDLIDAGYSPCEKCRS